MTTPTQIQAIINDLQQQLQANLKTREELLSQMAQHKRNYEQTNTKKDILEKQVEQLKLQQSVKAKQIMAKTAQKRQLEILLQQATESLATAQKNCQESKANFARLEAELQKASSAAEKQAKLKGVNDARSAYFKMQAAQNEADINRQKTQRELQAVIAELAGLNSEYAANDELFRKQQEQLQNLGVEIAKEKFEYDYIHDVRIPMIDAEIAKIKQELVEKQAELEAAIKEEIEQKRNPLLQKKVQLETDIATLQQLIEITSTEILVLQNEQSQLQGEEYNLNSDLHSIEAKITECEASLKRKQSEHEDLTKWIENNNESLKSAKERLEKLVEESNELDDEIARHNEELTQAKQEQEECSKEIEKMEKTLRENKHKYDMLKIQSKDFYCENHSLEQVAAGVCPKMNDLSPTKAAGAQALIQKMIAARDEVAHSEGAVKSLKADLEKIRSTVNSIENDLRKTKYAKVKKDYEKESATRDVTTTERKAQEAEEQIKTVADTITELKSEASQLPTKKSQVTTRLHEISTRLDDIYRDLNNKNGELNIAKDALQKNLLEQTAVNELLEEFTRGVHL